MKIRLFALARELGLDSKVLLERCDEAGVKLRNALATISPEQKDYIVAFIRNRGTGAAVEEPAVELAPVREDVVSAGTVREIRTMPPRPQHGDMHSGGVTEDSAARLSVDDAAGETAVAETVVAETAVAETAVAETAVAETAVAETAVAETEQPGGAGTSVADRLESGTADGGSFDEGEAGDSPVTRTGETAQVSEASADSETSERAPRRPAMHRMRDMKPIASVKDRDLVSGERDDAEVGEGGGRARSSALRPLVAALPSYTPPPVPKQDRGERVQKPDMALSDIVDRQSPLADQLKQLKSARAEHDGTDAGRGRATIRATSRSRKGTLLKELHESRQAARLAKRTKRRRRSSPVALKTSAQIDLPITVRTLSEAIGRPARAIMGILFEEGQMVTINDELTEDVALEVALELGVDLEVKHGRDIEAELLASIDYDDPEELLSPRPAIITILGHVDHGKTTLIDRLRRSDVAGGEAGGITQHIAAYEVSHEGQLLTFVDTPGHAAFGEMRSRGANVTDIVVLVVAADDGVMPQTEECISHAKNAGVPIVVALNKMDLPGVDEQKILQQLAQHDLLPAEWGGEYEVVRTSGETGEGIDTLLETLLLTAELHEYRANKHRDAIGVCLESFRDEGRGVLAWLIVQNGALRVGDNILCGTAWGRIRSMYNDKDSELTEAGPSTPVRVAGLSDVPGAGGHFFVMKDIEEARSVAENRQYEGRSQVLARRGQPLTLEDILEKARDGEGVQELPLIVKADSPGSIEALRGEITKFEHPEVRVSIIHEGIGGVNESDVYLASASGAIIIAFHVIAEDRENLLAEQEGVEIRRYNIIYEVTEHIRLALEGLLRPDRVEVTTGRAIVLRTFQISRFGTIAGCRVINGTISRDSRMYVIRDQKVLNSYRIASLKREKEDVKEVRDGMECGIRLEGFNDVKEGDLLEAYRIDEIQRTLSS